jgi:PAS domain S-box-containing protein
MIDDASLLVMLEKAQEVAHIGSWMMALDGSRRVVWSREMCRIHGIEPGAFDGTLDSGASFVHPADREGAREAAVRAISENRSYEYDLRIVRADGAIRWVRANGHIMPAEENQPARMIGTLQDITERRELEEQLLQAQKMEAIGRLAGGVAHDLNNALTAIGGFAELALGDLAPDHPAYADVQEARKAAERAGSVTRQLLAFSRRGVFEPRPFRLSETVDAIARFLGRLLGEDVRLELDLAPDTPFILGDPGQVEQAIVNLAVNARDAMPEGGRLAMTVRVQDVDDAFAASHVPMTPGRYVALTVADTGHGMSDDTRARIFEPFFTTKPVGKGTGLGLSMTWGTVKQMGGFVFVDSRPGVGTTFRLYFPPAQQAPAADPAPPPDEHAGAAAPAHSTVLVVDDEPSVRSLVFAALRNEGHRILLAASGDEALKTASEMGDAIDLLLTDATMPGTNGIELARELLARRPEMPVIVMSGYTQDHLAVGDLGVNVSMCQKPFTPRELRQRVKQALSR